MTITQLCAKQGLEIGVEQQNQMDRYTDFLLSENEKYNLTAVRDRAGVIGRHLFDSLAPIFLEEFPKRTNTRLLNIRALNSPLFMLKNTELQKFTQKSFPKKWKRINIK